MKHLALILATSVLAFAIGCRRESTTSQAARLALPAGDAIAGKKAFVEMRCWSCHDIYGGDMPKPDVTPPVPVYLGGNAIDPPDELYVLRAVVSPSHELASGWGTAGVARDDGASRMSDYSRAMTARQLFDVVAFVRSRYGPEADAAIKRQSGN